MTLPLPGINVEFTTEHARVIDTLSKVSPLGAPPPPFSKYNVSVWEAFRIADGDPFVTGEVIARECKRDPICPSEIVMQAKTFTMDAKSYTQPVLRSLRALMKGMGVLPGPKHVVLFSSGWTLSERDIGLRLAVRDVDGHLGSLERAVDARWRKIGAVESPGLVLLRAEGVAGSAPKPVFRPGRYLLTATIRPGNTPQFGRTFMVEAVARP